MKRGCGTRLRSVHHRDAQMPSGICASLFGGRWKKEMPRYEFICSGCDHIESRTVPMADRQLRIRCAECGSVSKRHWGFQSAPPSCYPFHSDAAGVHPDQVREAYAESVKQGVPTDFTPDGRAIFRDAKHRRAYCEKNGLFDRDAGYNDPTPVRDRSTDLEELSKSYDTSNELVGENAVAE